jgi:hypothetical protein
MPPTTPRVSQAIKEDKIAAKSSQDPFNILFKAVMYVINV